MFRRPRKRRVVSARTLRVLGVFFRYSFSREAWVLRGVGRWVGPVLRQASDYRRQPFF